MADRKAIVESFRGKRIAVLGDLVADCYVETHPRRLSREAPVMVLRYVRRHYEPGCAANTIVNLRLLGAEVVPLGIVGDDEPGRALLERFRESGVTTEGLVADGSSVVKVRLLSGDFSRPQQQVLRVDVEPERAYPSEILMELIARAATAEGCDGIVVSDYGYGVVSDGLLRAVREVSPDAVVSIDSRDRVDAFPDADLLTPNEQEASEILRQPVEDEAEAEAAARILRERSGAGAVLLTRGNRGMMLVDPEGVHRIPVAGSKEIVDPTGAGDTVVAAATLARAAGAGYLDAAHIANLAAGITVMKSGARGVRLEELLEAAGG